jgi:hypothetical protein
MSDAASKPARKITVWNVLRRIITVVAIAYCVGYILNVSNRHLEKVGTTAGFGRGLLNGIMMPAAMPNLAVGKDVTIYATNNNGIPYKLGYTAGVNLCGAVFFGLFFLRLNRWKKALHKPETAQPHARAPIA